MITDEVSVILHTALDRCNQEKKSNSLLVPLENVVERVSNYTGVPTTLIQKLSTDSSELTHIDQLSLLKCFKVVLLENKIPSINNIYAQYIKSQRKISSRISLSHFIKLINEQGYDYRKSRTGDLIIMENPINTFERYNYLKKIISLRNNQKKTFYYIDVKCLGKKVAKPNDNTSSDQYAHFFMISSAGYEHGLFTNQVNKKDFNNWISDILLPLFKPSSVIVMCNHQLLDTANKITCYSSKKQMCQWLKDNNIPYDTTMHKAELFVLIDKCTSNLKQYHIDRLLKSQGHEVLHLPSSLEISPTKLLYEYILKKVHLVTDTDLSIKQSVLNVIKDIGISTWVQFLSKSVDIENKIFDVDASIDKHYDYFCEVNVDNESTYVCSTCNKTYVQ